MEEVLDLARLFQVAGATDLNRLGARSFRLHHDTADGVPGLIVAVTATDALWDKIRRAQPDEYPYQLAYLYAKLHAALIAGGLPGRPNVSEPLALALGFPTDIDLVGRLEDQESGGQVFAKVTAVTPELFKLVHRAGQIPPGLAASDQAGWAAQVLDPERYFRKGRDSTWYALAVIPGRAHGDVIGYQTALRVAQVTAYGWRLLPAIGQSQAVPDLVAVLNDPAQVVRSGGAP